MFSSRLLAIVLVLSAVVTAATVWGQGIPESLDAGVQVAAEIQVLRTVTESDNNGELAGYLDDTPDEDAPVETPGESLLYDSFDPSADPDISPEVDIVVSADATSLPVLTRPDGLWKWRYHPRVSPHVFAILSYPYHREGSQFVEDGPVPVLDKGLPGGGERPAEPGQIYRALLEICEVIHEWRQFNESPGTALEVTFASELTRLSTEVYRIEPGLAVEVRRILGRMAYINRQFDETSRIALAHLGMGYTDPLMTARLKKQVSDLRALLGTLAQQNDAISVALGAGPIDRDAAWPSEDHFINYETFRAPRDEQR